MTSILKTDEIQSQNGGAVVKMQTLKHPSASGNNLELGSDGTTTITNGTLSAGTIGSSVTGFGLLTGADQFRLTTNFTVNGFVSGAHVERNETVFEKIGTGMGYDPSTGVFTFPNIGIWWIACGAQIDSTSGSHNYGGVNIHVSTTGVSGTYTSRAVSYDNLIATSSFASTFTSLILDVSSITSSTAVAVKFKIESSSTNVRFRGAPDKNQTHFTFVRLGDT